jgi:hypothetical protein
MAQQQPQQPPQQPPQPIFGVIGLREALETIANNLNIIVREVALIPNFHAMQRRQLTEQLEAFQQQADQHHQEINILINARLDGINARLDGMDARLNEIEEE